MSLFWKLVLCAIAAYFFLAAGFTVGFGIGFAIGVTETRGAGPGGHGTGYIMAGYSLIGGFLGLCAGVVGFIWWLSRQVS
jgi:hypothetical protein